MLRGMDGFDHYGDDVTLMLDGQYAEVNAAISGANPRSGARHLRITPGNGAGYRWVYGLDLEEAGHEFAFWIPNLPTNSRDMHLAQFRDNDNHGQFGVLVTTTGQVSLYRVNIVGEYDIIASSKPKVIKTKSYQHFGVRGRCDPVNGGVEVRINGVTVLNHFGANTQGANAPTPVIAQVVVGAPKDAVTGLPNPMDVDDATWWDTEDASGSSGGGMINDFVGDKKIYTMFPNADTSTEEWTPSVGTSTSAILANNPPSDDTEFLTAETAGLRAVVGLEDLPDTVVSISAVMTVARLWKTDAGNSKVKIGMISETDEDQGEEWALSEAPTYYQDVHETDPATGTLWTLESFNAAELSLERTE